MQPANIPERELIVWQDAELRGSLFRGMAEAATGQCVYLGSFAKYAEEDEEVAP